MNATDTGAPTPADRFGDDDSIPVLTERLADAAEPFAARRLPPQPVEPAAAAPAAAPLDATLRDDVRQAVVAQLAAEYVAILHERLMPAIEAAAAQLAAEAMESVLPKLPERIDAAIAAQRIAASRTDASEPRAPAVDLDHDDSQPVRSGD
jgi:hypothetical protein